MEAYQDFAYVYDELMDNTPYEEWCEHIDKLIKTYGISKPQRDAADLLTSEKNLVLDLGCGTGTLTQLMYDKGYDMIGVDSSESMLSVALDKSKANNAEILYICQDMRELALYSTIGTVISVCDSINYILEEEELEQVFSLIQLYLYPGGLFIFDFNTEYKYREVIGDTVIAENREDCSFIWENYYDLEEECNEYDLTVFVKEQDGRFRKFEETHIQRGYRKEQMERLLTKAGLTIIELQDSDTGLPAADTSQRICIVAKKQEA